MKPPVGIKDVAAHAGVSVATVSNVLNRPEIVAEATRKRVLASIAALGFVRNESARQLRAGRSRMIGLVVLDVANPFFTDVARGVVRQPCRELGRTAAQLLIDEAFDDDTHRQVIFEPEMGVRQSGDPASRDVAPDAPAAAPERPAARRARTAARRSPAGRRPAAGAAAGG